MRMRRFAQDQAYNFFEVEKKNQRESHLHRSTFFKQMVYARSSGCIARGPDPFIQFRSFGLVNNLLILNIITFATVAKMRIFEDSL